MDIIHASSLPLLCAVIFDPTVMGRHTGADIVLGASQLKVIGPMLRNALYIHDED